MFWLEATKSLISRTFKINVYAKKNESRITQGTLIIYASLKTIREICPKFIILLIIKATAFDPLQTVAIKQKPAKSGLVNLTKAASKNAYYQLDVPVV